MKGAKQQCRIALLCSTHDATERLILLEQAEERFILLLQVKA